MFDCNHADDPWEEHQLRIEEDGEAIQAWYDKHTQCGVMLVLPCAKMKSAHSIDLIGSVVADEQ